MNVQDPSPPAQSINLPAKSTILERLTDEVAIKLGGVISPHRLKVQTVWFPVDGTEPALKYLNAGLAKEALEHLEGTSKRSESLPAPFYYDLGLIYEINGRLDEAELMYKKAAALDLNEMYLKAIAPSARLKRIRRSCGSSNRRGNEDGYSRSYHAGFGLKSFIQHWRRGCLWTSRFGGGPSSPWWCYRIYRTSRRSLRRQMPTLLRKTI
jgi:tetratricopeptide (TPR) repeat protein